MKKLMHMILSKRIGCIAVVILFMGYPFKTYADTGWNLVRDTILARDNNYKVINIYSITFNEYGDYLEGKQKYGSQFYPDNLFSRLILIKNENDTIFNIPSIFSTSITIDKKRIVCMSRISFLNDYELVIYNLNGEIELKKSIEGYGIFISEQKYLQKADSLKTQLNILDSMGLLYRVPNGYWMDIFAFESHRIYRNEQFQALVSNSIMMENPISDNFRGSVSMTIDWYSTKNPDVYIKIRKQKVMFIQIRDPKNHKFRISGKGLYLLYGKFYYIHANLDRGTQCKNTVVLLNSEHYFLNCPFNACIFR